VPAHHAPAQCEADGGGRAMNGMHANEWPLTRLRTITTKIGSGATPRGGKESYKNNGITLIRSLNVYDFRFEYEGLAFIDDDQAEELSNVKVQQHDILLNITGASVARCCMVPTKLLPARVNQHVAIVRVNPTVANPYFVLYCINSPQYKHHLLTLAQGGATREALTKDTIGDFEIPLPPLPTQRKIASILSAYDDLIENNTQRIKILEEMAQALYREWFVNFRFQGHENNKKKDLSWEKIKIKDLPIQIIDGDRSTKYPKTNEFQSEGILFLNTKNIIDNKISLNEANFITPEKFSQIKKGRIQPLDILMTTRGSIGKIALFNCGYSAGLINAQMLILRSENKTVDQMFLFYLMCSEDFQEIVKGFSSGSAQPQIPIQDLKEIEIICPPISLQRKFSVFVTGINNLIETLQSKNINLRRTRDLLLPKLISGEVDVENIDIRMSSNISGEA
jgi:type I restriction enzyme S subunit